MGLSVALSASSLVDGLSGDGVDVYYPFSPATIGADAVPLVTLHLSVSCKSCIV